MEIKTISRAGMSFLVKEEGCILHPYRDSVGIPTIGIGCTYYPSGKRVTMKDKPITLTQALTLFKTVLKHYEKTVWSVTRDDITQNNFDALVSLCYNIGVNAFKGSTVLKLVNKDRFTSQIIIAFQMWRNAGGKPILLPRRKREWKLYFS